jgi:excisionase family DNA binding protein
MSSLLYSDLPPVADVPTWAKILDVHTDSIRKACRKGELKYVTLGRLWRIPRHSIVEWLTGNDEPRQNGDRPTLQALAHGA